MVDVGGVVDVTDVTELDDDEGKRVTVVVRYEGGETTLHVPRGQTLRDALLGASAEATSDGTDRSSSFRDGDLSPYTRLTERANCGGRGLCATCGVRLRTGPDPEHWHDRLAARFGYPRLSCQVEVEEGMVVELDEEKLVWGRRESE
jgi:hypothetical protein